MTKLYAFLRGKKSANFLNEGQEGEDYFENQRAGECNTLLKLPGGSFSTDDRMIYHTLKPSLKEYLTIKVSSK